MRDRNEKAPETISADVAIPIGLMTIVKVIDVRFISFRKRSLDTQYAHQDRRMAWRPKELHEFWNRLVKGTDV